MNISNDKQAKYLGQTESLPIDAQNNAIRTYVKEEKNIYI